MPWRLSCKTSAPREPGRISIVFTDRSHINILVILRDLLKFKEETRHYLSRGVSRNLQTVFKSSMSTEEVDEGRPQMPRFLSSATWVYVHSSFLYF